eukprot:TRINITY_DN51960_c0_g1_i1.p1 TRINITY_DN51960_c0_g1~~TRINITY_DN51960_c0_g1_i1.p1  ORF type:complete len:185 (+),score=28.21 TRINITY_DN51960_c0_g1_i1:84-638(+)
MALMAQRAKLPMCKHCDIRGTPQWITACGDHHQESCDRYRAMKCFTCKSCPIVGTAEWITASGQHHAPTCKRRSKAVLITCAHCELVGTKDVVMAVGPLHGLNCPRNPSSASSWFGGLFGSCCCTKQDVAIADPGTDITSAPDTAIAEIETFDNQQPPLPTKDSQSLKVENADSNEAAQAGEAP